MSHIMSRPPGPPALCADHRRARRGFRRQADGDWRPHGIRPPSVPMPAEVGVSSIGLGMTMRHSPTNPEPKLHRALCLIVIGTMGTLDPLQFCRFLQASLTEHGEGEAAFDVGRDYGTSSC
jgi:hypothetical protein